MMYKFRCHDCKYYIILSVTVDDVNLIAIYIFVCHILFYKVQVDTS